MPTTSDEENRQAKINFIRAFFNGLDTKTVFLDELFKTGRKRGDGSIYLVKGDKMKMVFNNKPGSKSKNNKNRTTVPFLPNLSSLSTRFLGLP